MSKETKNKQEEIEETEAVETVDVEALQAELAKVKEELAAANDKYLRLYAEYDNYRKRSDKEKSGIYASAYADAVKDVLPIGDNLARASQFTDPASVAKGVEMMQKSFTEALVKMGIEEIDAKGQPFDPELHNAVMHVEDETLGESVVADVLQKGYKMGDRVLRYAMVTVAN